MKNLLLLCLMAMLASAFTFTNDSTNSSDSTFYVLANSGLKLRQSPNLKAKKLLTIPFGEQITVLENGKSYGALTVNEFEGYDISGDWVKVRYNNKTGYLFNGYLTQMPLPSEDETFYEYFEQTLKVSKKRYEEVKREDCKVTEYNDCLCNWKEDYYDNKVNIHYDSCNDPGDLFNYTFTGISQREVYLLMYHFFNEEGYYRNYNDHQDMIEIEYEGEDAGGEVIQIGKFNEDGQVVVFHASSC